MHKLLALLALTVSFFNVSAQENGTLRLFLMPAAEAVKVNGEDLKSGNTIHLPPGNHQVQAWSPNKALLDTTIEIKAGEVINFIYHFENSPSYEEHLARVRTYNSIHTKKFLLPLATTTLLSGAVVFTFIKGKQVEADAEAQYLLYKYAGDDFEVQKQSFEELQDRYRKYYTAQFIEYAALAVSSYFLIKGIRSLKDNHKPTLKKDKNPFTLNQVGFTPTNYGGYAVGINLNIN